MAYQSIHTGISIDDGISINSTQNNRLTTLENKMITNTNDITTLKNKIIPISQGGTGATTVEQALINLSVPRIYMGNDIPDNSLGKDGDIYIKLRG